ncbi:MAG: hypothetical protein ABSF85_07105 [Terriglobales bacterium]
MSIRRCLILGWMVAGLQVVSAAQNPAPQQDTPAQSSGGDSPRTAPAAPLSAIAGMQTEGGAEDTSSSLPQIPALLGGAGVSAAFLSELERSNYLRGGVNVGAVYDSNPLLAPSGAESNTNESIFPNIKIEESSSRMHWTLGYAGGLTVNQKITSQNEGSQSLNFDSQYRLSPHVNLRVAESFSMTTGFFDAGNGPEVVAGSGGPNASLITPLSTQRSSVTTVEMNYHFALNDLIGASGSFYDLHFTNVPAGTATPLTDSETASGSAFWLHRIVGSDWGGVSYLFDRITFNAGSGETRVHSFLAMDTLNISKRLTLTGFIGPQYSENQGLVPPALQPTQSNDWSLAGGADGGWRNQRTSLSAGYSRMVSDGGGVLGSVRLQTVHANFRRQLTPGWAAALTASHGTNQSLIVPSATSATSVNLTSAGISLERNVGKSIGLRLGYTHDFQEQFGSPSETFNVSRNRFFVTLSYQWAKPLGM